MVTFNILFGFFMSVYSKGCNTEDKIVLLKIRDTKNPLTSCERDGFKCVYLNDHNKQALMDMLKGASLTVGALGRFTDGKEETVVLNVDGTVVAYNPEEPNAEYVFGYKRYESFNQGGLYARLEAEVKGSCPRKCRPKPEYTSSCHEYISSSYHEETSQYPIRPSSSLSKICAALKCSSCSIPCVKPSLISILYGLLKSQCAKTNNCSRCHHPSQSSICSKIKKIIHCFVNELCPCLKKNGYRPKYRSAKDCGIRIPGSKPKAAKEFFFNPCLCDNILQIPTSKFDNFGSLRLHKVYGIANDGRNKL